LDTKKSRYGFMVLWALVFKKKMREYLKISKSSFFFFYFSLCKQLSLKVSKEIFKETDHHAIILAEKDIGVFIPNLKKIYFPPDRKPDGMQIEYITCLNKEGKAYFS